MDYTSCWQDLCEEYTMHNTPSIQTVEFLEKCEVNPRFPSERVVINKLIKALGYKPKDLQDIFNLSTPSEPWGLCDIWSRQYVEKHGGKLVIGLKFWVTDACVKAAYHVIVGTDSGGLIDVTYPGKRMPEEFENHSLFLPIHDNTELIEELTRARGFYGKKNFPKTEVYWF